ncbi:hypothetical protein LCGC14_1873860, partial [marine sediment metagenome]
MNKITNNLELESPKSKSEVNIISKHRIRYKQDLNTLKNENRRFIQLLRDINRNFNLHSRGKFIENIQFSDKNENPTLDYDSVNNLGKDFTWKRQRVFPYHDLESRLEFDEKLIHQYNVDQNTLLIQEREFEVRKAARRRQELPSLLRNEFSNFIRKQEQLLTDFFNGALRENSDPQHISPLEQHARDLIKRILKENIAINLEGDNPQLMYLKDRKEIITIPSSRCFTEIQVLSQNAKVIKKILNSSMKFKKKYSQKTTSKEEDLKTLKNISLKQIFSYAMGMGVLLSILFLPVLMLLPSSSFLFSTNFKVNFPVIQVLIFSLSLVIYTWNKILSRRQVAYISITLCLLLVFTLVTKDLISLPVSIFIAPVLLICSLFFIRKAPTIQRVTHNKQRNSKNAIYSLEIRYHKNKYRLLWRVMLVVFIIFWIFFVFFPQLLFIPAFLFVVAIIIFTIDTNFKKKKYIRRLDRKTNEPERDILFYNSKLYRSACLILVFLMLMPLLFMVNSLVRLNRPNTQYAQISQESRIESSYFDFSTLEFKASMDELGELSINDKFLLKSQISTVLGESARMNVRFTPENVTLVEGYRIKEYYDLASKYTTGPLTDFDLITEIPLDKLGLLPGSYTMESTYNVITGFAYRYAETESQPITIVKDNLKAVPSRNFNLGIDYGVVYTIKRPDRWEIIYEGQIVNSLYEPVPVKNLTLYFEDFDKFIEIATLDTDENSNFYFNYTKYGNIEQNPLVRITYEGDGLYNPLDHVEYGGIEMRADQNWWFYDDDRDGWPEWPFTLYDLFAALKNLEPTPTTSSLSAYLAWMAELNENSGINIDR